MFEAVGEPYWQVFFKTLRAHVKPGGRVVLQVIIIAPEVFEAYRRNPDFIQIHVFPGGMLPTYPHLESLAFEHGFQIISPTFHGPDYVRTLEMWLERFDRAWPALAKTGYSERLRRLWRYYLSYCIAGFRTKRVDVVQFTLQSPSPESMKKYPGFHQ
ncbi:cyclopropane-fatty-acyl-phospholipid synthase [mine drainage metagenome]